jgi:modulator of FtsH protease
MENAYRPEAWHDLYIMLGGSSAALTGLFFVAMSIHLNEILRAPLLRVFARNNTIAMMESLVRAAFILMPQDHRLLAAELIVVHGFGLAMALNVVLRSSGNAPRTRTLRAGAIGLSSLLGIAGALSLILHWGGGMYVVTAAYLIFLCLVTSSAWALMTRVYRPEHRRRA